VTILILKKQNPSILVWALTRTYYKNLERIEEFFLSSKIDEFRGKF
jgi:hypothetical protein